MQTADLAYVSPTGQATPLTDEQLVAAAANTPPVGATEQSASPAPAREGTMARTRLPRTSTPMAGIGLLGMISLLGAAWLRFRA